MTTDYTIRDHQAWLGYLQPDGLVVSPAALVDAQVLLDRNVLPLQERFLEFVKEVERGENETAQVIADFPPFARGFLGWPNECLHGVNGTRPLPDSLSVPLPEFGETLTPTYAFKDVKPKDPANPWLLLVQTLPTGSDLDSAQTADDTKWNASPSRRFERLLRETGVPIGLLTNSTSFRLMYAPRGENSGNVTFPVKAMTEVTGRPILAAFHLLLDRERLLAAPSEARLLALLQKSREYQSSVSSALAQQVLDSLYELQRGFEAANERAKGQLLDRVLKEHPDDVYGGLLTVLMRLVFLLFAEDRGLMPGSSIYVRHYSVHGLFERLRADNEHHPDTMDLRYGAWPQLLTLFRAVHVGCQHPQMKMPARRGYLFDPDRFPFLEGRTYAEPSLPLMPDGFVFRVLQKLLLLDGERLSYRTLDVEEIGSVYQTVMGFGLQLAQGPSIAINGKRKHKSEVPAPTVINLDDLLAAKPSDRAKWLAERTGQELTGDADKALKAAAKLDDLLAALQKKIARNATPAPVPQGAMVLQPTDERRRSGSHYTPRKLTQPIVSKTLAPILKRFGDHPTPGQILELKICDLAVGSGAFQVETCRQLGDELVRAWQHHGQLPQIPPDEDEVLLARRIVAQRCLYGVDRNPMAVDLAKLSLWLATLAKDHPFTFLDHAFRCGDSIVGLTRQQIAEFHWKHVLQRILGQDHIEKRINAAMKVRKEIIEGGDTLAPELKRHKLEAADEALDLVRFAGDLVIAAFFNGDTGKLREANRLDYIQRLTNYLTKFEMSQRPTDVVRALRSGQFPVTPFHWEIEFPEVFLRENPGFDAVVGNPPFAGKNTLVNGNREGYLDWLKELHEESHGNADLVAHFFRRAFDILRRDACFGLIATNTIGQGDTRETGLRWICTHGGTIYSARKRYKWPGQAAVTVSVVFVIRGTPRGPFDLDGCPAPVISAYLFHAGGHESPAVLCANERLCFEGVKIYSPGFTFDDTDTQGAATPVETMRRLIANDNHNVARIFPYIGGEETNDSPTHAHHRYVIDFADFPLCRAELGESWKEADRHQREDWLRTGVVPIDYPDAVASDWPDLLRILEDKVKPQRLQDKREQYRRLWWQFGEKRVALNRRQATMPQVLLCCRVQPNWAITMAKTGRVFSDSLDVFCLAANSAFTILQSRVHEGWVRFSASTLEERLRYTPTDCFETFPFPAAYESDAALEVAGREYYEFRAALMVQSNKGLTKTYNRFHDPEERSSDIVRLRDLHAAMDRAVLTTYGWTDLIPQCTCEFLLDYEDEAEDESDIPRKRKQPWRYRWPDQVRDEVLARLLALNAQRAKEEKLAGETATTKAKPRRGKVRTVTTSPVFIEPALPTDFRLPASEPLLYTTSLVVALMSQRGGSLPWSQLLDGFVLATNPKLLVRFAPADLALKAKAWAARWNEDVPEGLLLPSLRQLGGRNLAITDEGEGRVFHLLDGPRRPATDDLRYDAWLALQIAETLTPQAVKIPQRAKWTKEANSLQFV